MFRWVYPNCAISQMQFFAYYFANFFPQKVIYIFMQYIATMYIWYIQFSILASEWEWKRQFILAALAALGGWPTFSERCCQRKFFQKNKIHINFPHLATLPIFASVIYDFECVRVLFIWLFLNHFYWPATLCHCGWILLNKVQVDDISARKQIIQTTTLPLTHYLICLDKIITIVTIAARVLLTFVHLMFW